MKHVVVTLSDWRMWLRSLIASVIGGAANGVTLMVIKPEDFNFSTGWPALKQFIAISALISAALYLKQSPLPPGHEVDDPGPPQPPSP